MSSLNEAIQKGNLAAVKELVGDGANVNQKDASSNTALHLAAWKGNLDIVTYLISVGAKVRTLGQYGWTVLMCAAGCEKPNTHVVNFLLSRGVSVNAVSQDNSHDTALNLACDHGHLETVMALVAGGADIDIKDGAGNTVLQVAVLSGRVEIVEYLISIGVDVHAVGQLGRNALMYSVDCPSPSADITNSLLSAGISVNDVSEGEEHDTALTLACSFGNVETVKTLVDQKADLDIKNGRGDTPLHCAAFCGNSDIVKYLLSVGADVNVKSHQGVSTLMAAVLSDKPHLPTMCCLLKAGVSINEMSISQGDLQHTALTLACENNNLEAVKILVDHGADIQMKDGKGYTPLHHAAYNGSTDIVKYLLAQGADAKSQSNNGMTTMMSAAKCPKPNVGVVQQLYKVDVPINAISRGEEHTTALILACGYGDLDTVKALVGYGAKLETRDNNENTPVHHAAFRGCADMVKYLMSIGANIHAIGNKARNVLMTAAQCIISNSYVVNSLIIAGIPVNAVSGDKEQVTALILACEFGHVDTVKALIAGGADIEMRDTNGDTALLCACRGGCVNIFKHLLSIGSNVQTVNKLGRNALMCASESNSPNIDIMTQLISCGISIDDTSTDEDKATAFILACKYGHLQNVQTLIGSKADMEIKNSKGQTALLCAAYCGHTIIVKYIILKGANLYCRDNAGKNVLMYAAQCKISNAQVVSCLIRYGISVNETTNDGIKNTALHLACACGHNETVKALVSGGANLEMRDGNGVTALQHAAINNHDEIVKYMKSVGAE